jgi:hypothetical protein
MGEAARPSLAELRRPMRQRAQKRGRSLFFFKLAAVMCVIVFLGFGPTFYLRAILAPRLGLPPLPSHLIYLHGFVFTAWMLLLLLQTGLVSAGKAAWHRRLGVTGIVLAIAVVIVGVAAQIGQTRRMFAVGEFERNFVLGPNVFVNALLAMAVFAGLAGAAFCLRSKPQAHKRLIILATVALIPAATARVVGLLAIAMPEIALFVPMITPGVSVLLILAVVMHDLGVRQRPHAATLYGAVAILAMHAVDFTPLSSTQIISEFAKRLVSL